MEIKSLINYLCILVRQKRNRNSTATKAGVSKILLLILLSCCNHSFSQNNDSLIHASLLDIQSMQVKDDGEFYAGMFPTYRECGGAPHNYQPDNTISYTAITAFTLRNMLPYLSE